MNPSAGHKTPIFLSIKAVLLALLACFCMIQPVSADTGERFSDCLKQSEKTIDQCVDQMVAPATARIAGFIFYTINFGDMGDNNVCELDEDCFSLRWIVVWLGVGALFFTVYLGFINVRGFKHALELVSGRYSDPNNPGEVSHFQALTTALSGTVGLGNIAGVAIAISVGGPGATFWMILAGILGMSSKFAECTLGVKYRMYHTDGSVSGGPKYYLTAGLSDLGLPQLGRILATFFAICCIGGAIGGGNMFQANQAFSMAVKVTGGENSFLADKGWLFGLVIALVVGIVIIGGIKSIAKVTARLVPVMALIYVSTALFIIISNISHVPAAFSAILHGAFSPEGVVGGAVGALIQGFQRAAFSNEAGIGSASIAHSAVKTSEPVTEGFVALLEPFIDTVVICTMTALVIIITGVYTHGEGLDGIELTSAAFSSVVPWFDSVLALAALLFAVSTMLSWSYYGSQSWAYIFGFSKPAEISFKLFFCCFIVIGSMVKLGNVVDFSDSMIFSMSIANLIGLYLLAPVLKRELNSYWTRLKSGEFEPR
ncbi:MAG: alanine:cation symporter family protein [Pseudomonadales bacterium]|nr:alanine:cation symporter family protein [Pseudomonadales bacterium]